MATLGDLENGTAQRTTRAPAQPQRAASIHDNGGVRENANDPDLWKRHLFRRNARHATTFENLSEEEAAAKHEELLKQGQPPKSHRFHPITATKITFKSTSTLSSWSNILFPTIPAGIVLWYTSRDRWPLAVFILNYIAMIPAGNLLAFASGELQAKMSKVISNPAFFERFRKVNMEVRLSVPRLKS